MNLNNKRSLQKAASRSPSPKRRRLNPVEDQVVDAKICSDYYSSDSLQERSSNESSNDLLDWDQILKQSELIKQMDVPSDILFLIGEFGNGDLIECWRCKKEDHIDGSIPLEDELEHEDDWVHFRGPCGDEYMCAICYDELLCTLCEERVLEDNFECENCGHVVCPECSDRHLEEHMDLDIAPPDSYFDELISADYYEPYDEY